MNTVLKWIGIAAVIVVTLVVIALVALYIYEPDLRGGWVKTGIAQDEIPAGVDTSVVFENVTVIPMDSERVLEEQTVVIEDGRIAAMGLSGEVEIPTDAHIVDGEGRFLIPGLSDMHMHTFGSENDLLVYLANGVTTIRIMGVDPPAILEWRDQIRAGTRVGPSIWAWWPSIENGYWGDPEWVREFQTRGGETYVHTPEEAEQLVAEMAALGVDGIKSHGVNSTEIYLALLESAANHGLLIDGHVPADHANCRPDKPECVCARPDCWDEFRTMGAPALAHLEELVKVVDLVDVETRQASDESIRQMAQDAADDGLWVTTSLYLMRSIADQAADLEGTLAAMPEVKYVHPTVFDTKKWGPGENYYVAVGSRPSWPGYLAAQEKMLPALNDYGGHLMSGTDASLAVVVPGFSLHDELETIADVGLSPYDVLRTSTYNPALYLGELDDFGTVEVGKRADLVLLEGNPLEDIANTRQIAGVMVRGRYFSWADLNLMLEAVARDYEAAKTTQAIVRIAFPIVVVLLLVSVVWLVVRRVRRRRAA
jgi:cytosine/adenosine deaminase-related metal-dependent hydrolase